MSDISRRDFFRLISRALAATGLLAIFAPVVAYFYPPELEEMPSEAVPVSPEADLPPGTGKTVRFGRYPALVIHTKQGLRAYSAVCTHFACIVKWDPESEQIVCPCHDGFFDPLDGSVLAGPPPTALEALPVKVEDGQIFVGGAG
ncbi:MAG: Rieske (2Fe-2S) protein [Anaerolineales bacterium]